MQKSVICEKVKARPFVKWAGGKRGLLPHIRKHIPSVFGSYYELFVGGGALFFDRQPKQAVLADINTDLMIAYAVIKEYPEALLAALKTHKENHGEAYYYAVRKKDDKDDAVTVAARFIYLNRTCYNGLYRENSTGAFNVPMGRYKDPAIVDTENIWACHEALQQATLRVYDFEKIIPKAGDFLYLDPPYHRVKGTSFTKYAKGDFDAKDQERLACYCQDLDKKGVFFLLSNACTEWVCERYKQFTVTIVDAPRFISCKGNDRLETQEVLVRNY